MAPAPPAASVLLDFLDVLMPLTLEPEERPRTQAAGKGFTPLLLRVELNRSVAVRCL